MAAGPEAALRRVAAWRPHAAAVYGSGLWALPEGGRVVDEVPVRRAGLAVRLRSPAT